VQQKDEIVMSTSDAPDTIINDDDFRDEAESARNLLVEMADALIDDADPEEAYLKIDEVSDIVDRLRAYIEFKRGQ
jgi:hypothetical protein